MIVVYVVKFADLPCMRMVNNVHLELKTHVPEKKIKIYSDI